MAFFDMDKLSERFTRRMASGTSRRGMLNKLGKVLIAAPVFPLLPMDRKSAQAAEAKAGSEFAENAQTKDDTKCNYWRYCAIDGFLCTCCGGGVHTCPAGTSPSPTSWVGTCLNPEDGRSYLISYFDCCGTATCGQCLCDNTERAAPIYRPMGNNEIIWCFGTDNMAYHCSTATLVGVAGEG